MSLPLLIELYPREAECIACGETTDTPQGIPLYEGRVVRPAELGEWAGFDACRDCWALYEQNRADERPFPEWRTP